MKSYKLVGWGLLIVAIIFWAVAVSGASSSGFFEYQNGVQLMFLGGAVAMIGGVFLWYED